jgi:hypothetical protein
MIRTLTFLLLAAFAARAADDDETRFKPRAYAPGKTLQDRTYRAPAYVPSDNPRPTGTPLKTSRSGFWGLFKQKSYDEGKRLEAKPLEEGLSYKQERQIAVPTMSANAAAATENKPFVDSGEKLADAGYQAPEKSHDKNPLLKPRQGIKETP